eukprot:3695344-Amphidinium_carterae.1
MGNAPAMRIAGLGGINREARHRPHFAVSVALNPLHPNSKLMQVHVPTCLYLPVAPPTDAKVKNTEYGADWFRHWSANCEDVILQLDQSATMFSTMRDKD